MIHNRYRHSTPSGWNNITEAPRDGTVIEIQNNWGIAPTYSICKWVDGRGWQKASDANSGVSDGPHLSWRPYVGSIGNYQDPTGGAQDSMEYWDRAIIQATGGRLNPAVERARNAKRASKETWGGTRKPSLMQRVADLVFGEGNRD